MREATSGGTRRRRRSLGCRRVMGALRTQRSAVRGQAVESGAFALRGKKQYEGHGATRSGVEGCVVTWHFHPQPSRAPSLAAKPVLSPSVCAEAQGVYEYKS